MGHKKLIDEDQSLSYPEFLKQSAKSGSTPVPNAPIVIDMSVKDAKVHLEDLAKEHPGLKLIDNYAEQYAELLLSKSAHLYRANHNVQVSSITKQLKKHYGKKQGWELGSWVYYPWNRSLVHVLAKEDFEDLRTIRNRDLITKTEQEKLFDFEVVAFGMSVGSAAAQALAITGTSRKIKLVDGAVISGSNLNRILTGVSSVGESKAATIGRQIYEMNPYSTVEYFDKVTEQNIDDIFNKPWPVKVAIDEIDDIEMKVRIRHEAKKRNVPVVMATELGDTVMLDIERFDLEPDREMFHGDNPEIKELLDRKIENYREWIKHAVRMIGPHNMQMKMQKSLLKIGGTIVTHPQLGSSVMMTGGILAFAVKSIALGHPLKSGRYVISLEKELLSDHKTRRYKREHKKHTKVIHKAIDSMQ